MIRSLFLRLVGCLLQFRILGRILQDLTWDPIKPYRILCRISTRDGALFSGKYQENTKIKIVKRKRQVLYGHGSGEQVRESFS